MIFNMKLVVSFIQDEMKWLNLLIKLQKRLLVKAAESGKDPYLTILHYKNTLKQDSNFSPAQDSLGKRTRTLFAMLSSQLNPYQIDNKFVKIRKILVVNSIMIKVPMI